MFQKYLQVCYFFWARIYDSVLDKLFKFDRKKVIRALNAKPNHKILEVGIGTGLNLPYYPKCTVYGIDRLIVYPEKDYAETNQKVTIDNKSGRTLAGGMQAFFGQGRFIFYAYNEQRVHTILLPTFE